MAIHDNNLHLLICYISTGGLSLGVYAAAQGTQAVLLLLLYDRARVLLAAAGQDGVRAGRRHQPRRRDPEQESARDHDVLRHHAAGGWAINGIFNISLA